MLLTTHLERVFIIKEGFEDITLPDPEPGWSVERVLSFYSGTYPILITAKIAAPEIKDDTVQYRFESVMGTKG